MKKIFFIFTETEETSRTGFRRKIRNQELGFQKLCSQRRHWVRIAKEPRQKPDLEIQVWGQQDGSVGRCAWPQPW